MYANQYAYVNTGEQGKDAKTLKFCPSLVFAPDPASPHSGAPPQRCAPH